MSQFLPFWMLKVQRSVKMHWQQDKHSSQEIAKHGVLPYNIRFKAYICKKLSKKQEKSKHFLACASFEQNEQAGECTY